MLKTVKSINDECLQTLFIQMSNQCSKCKKSNANIKALELKRLLELAGKKIMLIAMTEITDERLLSFEDIDAFIQVACPRIGTDNHFHKPVLSVPQAISLIKLLKGEPHQEFLQIKHWL